MFQKLVVTHFVKYTMDKRLATLVCCALIFLSKIDIVESGFNQMFILHALGIFVGLAGVFLFDLFVVLQQSGSYCGG